MFFGRQLIALSLLGLSVAGSTRVAATTASPNDLDSIRLVHVGVGKGAYLGWDLGMIRAAAESMPAFEQGKVILAANSGATFIAAYFTCRGFTPETLKDSVSVLRDFDPRLVNQNRGVKLAQLGFQMMLFQNYTKRWLEEKITTGQRAKLEPSLNRVLQDGKCVPKIPTIFYAANARILDNRDSSSSLKDLFLNRFDGKDEKTIDYRSFNVLSPQQEPLGKACTYFATPELFARLSKMPADERVCDLRPIRNGEDLRVAILASISEPTYFPWFEEPHPELIQGELNPVLEKDGRAYNGGFGNAAITQDLRRILPQVAQIGSGRPLYTDIEKGVIRGLYSIKLGELLPYGKWWLDMEIAPTAEIWNGYSSEHADRNAWFEKTMRAGHARAMDCFYKTDNCLPAPVTAPIAYSYAFGDASLTPLKTRRGRAALGTLLRGGGQTPK